ncbi:MAG: hypothetical protein FJ315_06590, partial [SAR202 cluster bacterium]|nr:hypothetical protein [SAR202 cluster bacterium]
MGLNALFHSDGGTPDLPQTPHDWTRWVSATSTRNYVLGDPILDWLDAYGFERGFLPDDRHAGYEPRTDFASFVFQQGRRFEQAVMKLIRDAQPRIVTIAHDPAAALDPGRAEATFTAMAEAAPVIEHGVLRDAENRTYGVPDLLVRSDVLANLFPVALSRAEAGV